MYFDQLSGACRHENYPKYFLLLSDIFLFFVWKEEQSIEKVFLPISSFKRQAELGTLEVLSTYSVRYIYILGVALEHLKT